MRRNAQSLNDEDFFVLDTLLIESYWDCTDKDHKEQLERN